MTTTGLGKILLAGAIGLVFSCSMLPAPASAERPFSVRFAENAPGDITMAANTVMSCDTTVPKCPEARDGTATPASALNNNGYTMGYVDVDDDPSTFNSSGARLEVPAGATVLFAGLYHGGRLSTGTHGHAAPNPGQRGSVRLKAPGGSYQPLTASVVDDSTGVNSAYSAFTDITSVVAAGGPGLYTVADVQAGTGVDRYGGWSIVVAYRDETQPPRNLTVFDGLLVVGQADPPHTIAVTGFQTPTSGPVRTQVGFVAYEGDRGSSGDRASLNGQNLADAANPANNFFNSSISKDGQRVTTGEPNYDNQLGFDAILTRADGYLANGDSSANITLSTSLDQYLPAAITFATDLFAPEVRVEKSVTNLSDPGGPVKPGDRLRYSIRYSNDGLDGAADFVASDKIPAGTTYLPGSLRITAGPGSPASPTDAGGDDRGEFDQAAGLVRFRLGQGASAADGGLISGAGGAAESTAVAFEVEVGAGTTSGTVISNIAAADFESETVGVKLSAESPAVLVEVAGPVTTGADLSVTKTVDTGSTRVGLPLTYAIEARNLGPEVASAVKLTDLPSGPADLLGVSSAVAACGSDFPLHCSLGDLAPGETVSLKVRLRARSPGSLENRAEVSSPTADPVSENNSATTRTKVKAGQTTVALDQKADHKRVLPGKKVRFTITVKTKGRAAAIGTRICQRLPAGLVLVKARGAKLKQGRICWKVPTLAQGAKRKFKVIARAVNSPRSKRVTVVLRADGVNVEAGPVKQTLRLPARAGRPGGVTG